MATDESNLTNDAMSLPRDQRAALAHQLLQSLEPEEADALDEEDWLQEIIARSDAVHSGEAELIDGDEVLARARRNLARKRGEG